jgi:hypothetical protein
MLAAGAPQIDRLRAVIPSRRVGEASVGRWGINGVEYWRPKRVLERERRKEVVEIRWAPWTRVAHGNRRLRDVPSPGGRESFSLIVSRKHSQSGSPRRKREM